MICAPFNANAVEIYSTSAVVLKYATCLTCFKEAQLALLCRQLDCIPLYDKRGYMLKATAYSTIAICGVLGLIQAFIGV